MRRTRVVNGIYLIHYRVVGGRRRTLRNNKPAPIVISRQRRRRRRPWHIPRAGGRVIGLINHRRFAAAAARSVRHTSLHTAEHRYRSPARPVPSRPHLRSLRRCAAVAAYSEAGFAPASTSLEVLAWPSRTTDRGVSIALR